jgi:hypothetical protein
VTSSEDSATPRKTCCDSCLEKGRKEYYHSDNGDESTLLRLTADLQQMTTTHHFLQFEDTSGLLLKLQSHLNPSQFEKEKDASNLEFVPQSDIQKREHYLSYLKPNLSLHLLSLMGSHMECVQQLRMALELMTRKVEIETTMRVTGDNAGALLLQRQAIPCILHCENRCGENFSKTFFWRFSIILLGKQNCRMRKTSNIPTKTPTKTKIVLQHLFVLPHTYYESMEQEEIHLSAK